MFQVKNTKMGTGRKFVTLQYACLSRLCLTPQLSWATLMVSWWQSPRFSAAGMVTNEIGLGPLDLKSRPSPHCWVRRNSRESTNFHFGPEKEVSQDRERRRKLHRCIQTAIDSARRDWSSARRDWRLFFQTFHPSFVISWPILTNEPSLESLKSQQSDGAIFVPVSPRERTMAPFLRRVLTLSAQFPRIHTCSGQINLYRGEIAVNIRFAPLFVLKKKWTTLPHCKLMNGIIRKHITVNYNYHTIMCAIFRSKSILEVMFWGFSPECQATRFLQRIFLLLCVFTSGMFQTLFLHCIKCLTTIKRTKKWLASPIEAFRVKNHRKNRQKFLQREFFVSSGESFWPGQRRYVQRILCLKSFKAMPFLYMYFFFKRRSLNDDGQTLFFPEVFP